MTIKEKMHLANEQNNMKNIAESQGMTLKYEGVSRKTGQEVYKVINQGLGGLHLFVGGNGGHSDMFNHIGGSTSGNTVSFVKNIINNGSGTWEQAYDKVLQNAGVDTNHDYDFEKSKNQNYVSNDYDKIKQEQKMERGDVIVPNKSQNNNWAFNYLTKTRGIDEKLANYLFNEDLVRQVTTTNNGREFTNIAFVGKDFEDNDKVKFCFLRSMEEPNSNSTRFTQICANSDTQVPFRVKGKGSKLFVFESPIDALSHVTLCKLYDVSHTDHRISCGGTHDNALKGFLDNNKNITDITFCFDNDTAGQKSVNELMSKYADMGFNVHKQKPKGKDFNEDLKVKLNSLDVKLAEKKEVINTKSDKSIEPKSQNQQKGSR